MAWRFASASVAGVSHIAAGTPCQDAHRCVLVRDGAGQDVLVVVASDGAGSAQKAVEGSTIVVESVVEQVVAWIKAGGRVRNIDRACALDWLNGAREVIAGTAGDINLAMRDFAATMLLAVVDAGSSAFAQIGDGAIVTSETPGEWGAQRWPQRGQYANQTFFVTDDGVRDRLFFARGLAPVHEIAVFTDGLERVVLDFAGQRAHAPAFERMLNPLRASPGSGAKEGLSAALGSYLASPAIASRADDDLTLVIATRRPGPVVPAAPSALSTKVEPSKV